MKHIFTTEEGVWTTALVTEHGSQSVVDGKNSNYFTEYGFNIIADHVNQDFAALSKSDVGSNGTLDGRPIVCVRKEYGYNYPGGWLKHEDKTEYTKLKNGSCLLTYTCSGRGDYRVWLLEWAYAPVSGKELRQLVVDTACSYLGCKESDGTHKKIIDIYNSQPKLPRGYRVTYADAWCATYVSAISVLCGITDIMPTECGCEQMITLYKKLDGWTEDESITPDPGDIIFYDWEDNGAGDDTGYADHVGIVTDVTGGVMKIIEGNMSDAVSYRDIPVNARYIRGYGRPKYDQTEENKMKELEIKEGMEPYIQDVTAFGVDISNHNTINDYDKFAGMIGFAIMKLTEGQFFVDGKFGQHYRELHGRGIPVGVYSYSHATCAEYGRLEAEYLLENLGELELELPIYIDVEGDVLKAGKDNVLAGVLAFGERIKSAGRRWGVYASESVYGNILDIETLRDAGASIWVANYSRSPEIECDIHQYTDSLMVPGSAGNIDHDRMFNDIIKRAEKDPAEDASEWAKESCRKAVNKGIVSGYGDGEYGWQENITREQMCVMLDNLGLLE